jgi:cytochrome oxidase Cu insertion factor (SCO1/SenC/PrrC family)
MKTKVILLVVMLACSAISTAAQQGMDIGGNFTLTDHEARRFELQQVRGKVVLMYFGYTSCPDVCPIELAGMAQFFESLGVQKDSVQVLFVTVDPARDTPARLKEFVGFFHKEFIGLSGSEEEIDQVKKTFHVQSKIFRKTGSDANYSVDHNASLYVIDQTGKLVNIVPYGIPLSHVASILEELLK